MSQQDTTHNKESLSEPELTAVAERANVRMGKISRYLHGAENAWSIMGSANSGHGYEKASNWVKPNQWARIAKESDYLRPLVASDHTAEDLQKISGVVNDGELKLDEVLRYGQNEVYVDAITATDETPSAAVYDIADAQKLRDAQKMVDDAFGEKVA